MKVWLCPVKKRSWNIIKHNKLFGVSSIGKKLLNQVEPNDLLLIYLLSPAHRIISLCRVRSKLISDDTDLWGASRYPYRIKIEIIKEFRRGIPGSRLLGRNDEEEIEIVPYLRGIEIMEIIFTENNKSIDAFEDDSRVLNTFLKFLSEP